jgi:uncharacterized SAM-binding protein YcdF (DUF218 family)
MKRILVAVLCGLGIVALAFAVLAFDVYSFGGSDALDADAAIVLGAAIDGDEPSPAFRERINHGIHLLESGKVRWIILTGGRPDGCESPESLVAKRYAIRHGVPEDRILMETDSHTTYQNLYYARELALEHDLRTLVVVSDPYHLRRAMRMAENLGLNARPSPTPTSKLNNLGFLMQETWRNAAYLGRHALAANSEADELAVSSH